MSDIHEQLRQKEEQKRREQDAEKAAAAERVAVAKLAALDQYMPDELFECDVANYGKMLFRFPGEIDHNVFAKRNLLKPSASLAIEDIEFVLAQCAIEPKRDEVIGILRKRNAHARIAIVMALLSKMREGIAAEGNG